MAVAGQKNKSAITLKGSADIVCDYLNFGINSILYQRGLYPTENFATEDNYGLTMLMIKDKNVQEFLATTLNQLNEWLVQKTVNKIALIIVNVKTLEVMERWDFYVEYEGENNQDNSQISNKPLEQIKKEIRDVMRQITSSITYLPLLDCLCSFDIQIYTKSGVEIPNSEWSEAAPANIQNAQSVKIRPFSTDLHRMDTVVTFKNVYN